MKNLVIVVVMFLTSFAYSASQADMKDLCFVVRYDWHNDQMAEVYGTTVEQANGKYYILQVQVVTDNEQILKEAKFKPQDDITYVWGFAKKNQQYENKVLCSRGVLVDQGYTQGRLSQLRNMKFYPSQMRYSRMEAAQQQRTPILVKY